MSEKKMPSLDSLFGGCGAENPENNIVELDTALLIPYSKHPFTVKESRRLEELRDSIQRYGVLTPLLIREHPIKKDRYEILAGHHRAVAARGVGINAVPCIIRNVDDSTAALMVIDSNKQRGFADMLPSEIAKALKLEYDALKCQGKRTDLVKELEGILNEQNLLEKSGANAYSNRACGTSVPMGPKLISNGQVVTKNSISVSERKRYIRLNYLIPSLLNMVDDNKIAIRPAVDISFLKEDEQQVLLQELETAKFKLDMKKAEKLKEYSARKKLTSEIVLQILSGTLLEKRVKRTAAISLPYKRISDYVDTSLAPKAVEDYIIEALEFYKQNKN